MGEESTSCKELHSNEGFFNNLLEKNNYPHEQFIKLLLSVQNQNKMSIVHVFIL